MITNRHTEKDILKEVEKARNKYNQMYYGWFGKKISRLQKKKYIGFLIQQFTIERQKYNIHIAFVEKTFFQFISTTFHKESGKYTLQFSANKNGEILITSPHFKSRAKERNGNIITHSFNPKIARYIRDGVEYELRVEDDIIDITRRSKENPTIVYYITTLNVETCKSKNLQELISRATSMFDVQDIWEWK